MKKVVYFRFYSSLNDFLKIENRQKAFAHTFQGSPTIKDTVQALGIPHIEVNLILANGIPVDFSYHIKPEDHFSVYPMFKTLDIESISRLPASDTKVKFVVDAHLGKLSRYLRMLGLDTFYDARFLGTQIIQLSAAESRAILTRNVGILMQNAVRDGYFIRSTAPKEQLREVIDRFVGKSDIKPFSRCLNCNGNLTIVEKQTIVHLLEEQTKKDFDEFYQCTQCQKLYWKGSHHEHMQQIITQVTPG